MDMQRHRRGGVLALIAALAVCWWSGLCVERTIASSVPTPPVVLASDATATVRVAYRGCFGGGKVGTAALPPGLVGRTRTEVASRLPEYRITEFNAHHLGLERIAPGCPNDQVTLLDRGGVVTAVAGEPGGLGSVMRQSDIAVRGLSPRLRQALERGIVVPAPQLDAALDAVRHDTLPTR